MTRTLQQQSNLPATRTGCYGMNSSNHYYTYTYTCIYMFLQIYVHLILNTSHVTLRTSHLAHFTRHTLHDREAQQKESEQAARKSKAREAAVLVLLNGQSQAECVANLVRNVVRTKSGGLHDHDIYILYMYIRILIYTYSYIRILTYTYLVLCFWCM